MQFTFHFGPLIMREIIVRLPVTQKKRPACVENDASGPAEDAWMDRWEWIYRLPVFLSHLFSINIYSVLRKGSPSLQNMECIFGPHDAPFL